MSDEKPNQTSEPSQAAIPPANPPQTAESQTQPINTPPPEDPFALNPRLIGEIQKGGNAPEQTAVQQPEVVRNKPIEKK